MIKKLFISAMLIALVACAPVSDYVESGGVQRAEAFDVDSLVTPTAVIASVTVESVTDVAAESWDGADLYEGFYVQAAMDLFMADTDVLSVTANAVLTNDFEASNPALWPVYLLESPTNCAYTWDPTGLVTQGTCDSPPPDDYEWVPDEWDYVQAAMDMFMADTGALTVAANANPTNDFVTSVPTLSPAYLRGNPTECTYTWDSSGLVTQQSCDPPAHVDPTADLAELNLIQAAMDLFMTDTSAISVTTNATPTNDFTESNPALSPLYLPGGPTVCTYTWTPDGSVTQVACDRSNPDVEIPLLTELDYVQAAMNLYMADTNSVRISRNQVPTRDFRTSNPVLWPAYLQDSPTDCTYTWETFGEVVEASCDPPPSDPAADAAELNLVQAAMNLLMAESQALSVPVNAIATNDFTMFAPVLSPLYLREGPTVCTYTWSTTGRVQQTACDRTIN